MAGPAALAPHSAAPGAPPDELTAVLRERFGLRDFRPWQREAIDAVLHGSGRVLVVAPTGRRQIADLPGAGGGARGDDARPLAARRAHGGPGARARGARHRGDVPRVDARARRAARTRGRDAAAAATSSSTSRPSASRSDAFVETLARCRVAARRRRRGALHRAVGARLPPRLPAHRARSLERLRPPRVLACTATATPRGAPRDPRAAPARRRVQRGPPRLRAPEPAPLGAQRRGRRRGARKAVFEALAAALGEPRAPRGGAIVYAATRKQTEQWAETLRGARLERRRVPRRDAVRGALATSRRASPIASLDLVVATNAFGMGIDRVRHPRRRPRAAAVVDRGVLPGGRARAGATAPRRWGLLLCSGADIALRRRLVTTQRRRRRRPPPELAARAWALFRELLRYLDARTCRHDFILRYFGDEQELLGGCGHCDVCAALDDAPTTDDGDDGRRRRRRTSSAWPSRPSRARSSARGSGRSPTCSAASTASARAASASRSSRRSACSRSARPRGSLDLLRGLLAAGWIDLTPTDHPVPLLTRAGADVMRGAAPRALRAARRARAHASRKRARPSAGAEGTSGASSRSTRRRRDRFERLRAHRAQMARARGVPAYVVALDRTLVEMAARAPAIAGRAARRLRDGARAGRQLRRRLPRGPARLTGARDRLLAAAGAPIPAARYVRVRSMPRGRTSPPADASYFAAPRPRVGCAKRGSIDHE